MARQLDEIGPAATSATEALARIASPEHLVSAVRDICDPPALRQMREQISKLADPPYMRALRELTEVAGSARWRDLAVAMPPPFDPAALGIGASRQLLDDLKRMQSVELFPALRSVTAGVSLSEMIGKRLSMAVESISSAEGFATLMASWPVPDFSAELESLAGMSSRIHGIFASLDLGNGFANRLNVEDVTRSTLGYEADRLSRAFHRYNARLVQHPEWFKSAPKAVRSAPAEVVLSHARLVRCVTSHAAVEEETHIDAVWSDVQARTLDYIEAVLPELNPNLLTAWKGTWAAARRKGPDWARHAAASLRFLLISVLDAVAPVAAITASALPKGCVDDKGKIRRLGQIHWLCVPLQNDSYRKFVRADLDSTLTIIEAMNEAVHRDGYEEIEAAFESLAVRAAVSLGHLLKIWKCRA